MAAPGVQLEVTEASGWWWSWSCVLSVCRSGGSGGQCSQEDSEDVLVG